MIDASGLVSGRYRLGELLGTGGSASVFAAVDEASGEHVALKLLHPHLSHRPSARDAFLAEARRVQGLRHPNVVGVLEVGVDEASDEPVAWIALERAAGLSLAEHVDRHGPLGVADALTAADGVLRALEAAHAVGLVHRDVSPANVMIAIDGDGRLDVGGVRLLDFGLADAAGRAVLGGDVLRSEAVNEGTGRAGVIGNVNYMSPEQVRGAAVDERGDVYQAGGMLHFALTGKPPFLRDDAARDDARASGGAAARAVGAGLADPARALDRMVVRALLKDPATVSNSAAEMRSVLAAIAGRARHRRAGTVAQTRTRRPAKGRTLPSRRDPSTRPYERPLRVAADVPSTDVMHACEAAGAARRRGKRHSARAGRAAPPAARSTARRLDLGGDRSHRRPISDHRGLRRDVPVPRPADPVADGGALSAAPVADRPASAGGASRRRAPAIVDGRRCRSLHDDRPSADAVRALADAGLVAGALSARRLGAPRRDRARRRPRGRARDLDEGPR